jgi:hypothetical protein
MNICNCAVVGVNKLIYVLFHWKLPLHASNVIPCHAMNLVPNLCKLTDTRSRPIPIFTTEHDTAHITSTRLQNCPLQRDYSTFRNRSKSQGLMPR